MKKIITLNIFVWLTTISIVLSAPHNDISIQYINSPANTIPDNSSAGTPLAYIYSTNATPFSITDNIFYIDTNVSVSDGKYDDMMIICFK